MKVKIKRNSKKEVLIESIQMELNYKQKQKYISDLSSKYYYFLTHTTFSNPFLYSFFEYSNIDDCLEEIVKYSRTEKDHQLLKLIYQTKKHIFRNSFFYHDEKNKNMFIDWIKWDKTIYKWIVNDWKKEEFYKFFTSSSISNLSFLWEDIKTYQFFHDINHKLNNQVLFFSNIGHVVYYVFGSKNLNEKEKKIIFLFLSIQTI